MQEETRYKGTQPINEAIVAYGAALQPFLRDRIFGDLSFTEDQQRALIEDEMNRIRRDFTERQAAYKKYTPSVVIDTSSGSSVFSLRLDGWEIGTIC
ncbi:hypothetical protein [Pseudomonas phage D6]|nr:hypothetical protein [Pseudomonas phage D6]